MNIQSAPQTCTGLGLGDKAGAFQIGRGTAGNDYEQSQLFSVDVTRHSLQGYGNISRELLGFIPPESLKGGASAPLLHLPPGDVAALLELQWFLKDFIRGPGRS